MPKMAGEDDLSSYIDEQAGIASLEDTTTEVETEADDGAETTSDGTPASKSVETQDKGGKEQQAPDGKQGKEAKKDEQSKKDDASAKPRITRTPNGNLLDAKGNIVDEAGNIIAPIGKSRRIYEDNQRLTRDLGRVTEERNRFELQTREVQLLNGIPQQYGLNHDEVARALDYAGRMKKGDAVGVARDIIALLSAQGHNISDLLGSDVGDSIDMRGLKAMLDERLGPIQQREEKEQRTTQQMEEGRRQYERFVADNEYADVHGEAIVNLSRAQGVSAQVAYNKIKDFAYANQFDFSQPLGPQIAERASQGQRQQNDQNNGQQRQQRPLPGNGPKTRDNGVRDATPQYADPEEDWGSIIRRAM